MTDIKVYKNSVSVGKAAGIDFKEGNGVALTVARDDLNNQTDVTIAAWDTGPYYDTYGWKGWNYPAMLWNAAQAYTSGATRFGVMPLQAGQVVTNIFTSVSVAASSVTTIKYGIYDSSGNRLAVTDNSTTAHDAVGWPSIALTAPYTVTTTGGYYFAALVVAGTAGSCGTLASVTGKAFPGGTPAMCGGTEAGQTDLDATVVVSGSNVLPWFGWS